MKITSKRLAEIKDTIANAKKSLEEGIYKPERLIEELVEDADLMVAVIDQIRIEVHFAEDADALLSVAELVGTNCSGKDIDEED